MLCDHAAEARGSFVALGVALTTSTALANQESPMAETKTKPTGASVDAYLLPPRAG